MEKQAFKLLMARFDTLDKRLDTGDKRMSSIEKSVSCLKGFKMKVYGAATGMTVAITIILNAVIFWWKK